MKKLFRFIMHKEPNLHDVEIPEDYICFSIILFNSFEFKLFNYYKIIYNGVFYKPKYEKTKLKFIVKDLRYKTPSLKDIW